MKEMQFACFFSIFYFSMGCFFVATISWLNEVSISMNGNFTLLYYVVNMFGNWYLVWQPRSFGFAGTKDKRAVSTQRV